MRAFAYRPATQAPQPARKTGLRRFSPPAPTLYCIGCFFWTPVARAQPGGGTPRLSFELRAATTALVGTPFEIEATARFPDRYQLSLDPPRRSTGPFVITEVRPSPAETALGIKTQTVRLKAVPFELGDLTFPPLDWTLQDAAGKAEAFRSPPMKIHVAAPRPVSGDTEDIRDIHPPMTPLLWPFALAAALGLAAAAWGAVRYWRKFLQKSHVSNSFSLPADSRPPHEVALDALRKLQGVCAPPKTYYGRITEILRTYLEGRFGIPAPVLTTTDLLRRLRRVEIERTATTAAKDIFERADLAKFAKLIPPPDTLARDLESAAEFVCATAPKSETPDASPPPVPKERAPAP